MKKAVILFTTMMLAMAALTCIPALKGHENPFDVAAPFTAGTNWTLTTAAAPYVWRYYHSMVTFKNRLWILGGFTNTTPPPITVFNDVWHSADGTTWSKSSADMPTVRLGHASVVFDGRIWAVGGATATVWSSDAVASTDGTNWSSIGISFTKRSYCAAAVFNRALWVIGGYCDPGSLTNDVWYTYNGMAWSKATGSAGFSPRRKHKVLVYENKMWLIGGDDMSGPPFKNDVWNTSDGTNWVQVTASANFSKRYAHAATVFRNRMVIIAGMTSSGAMSDLWYSSDGSTWIQAATTSGFPAKYGIDAAVFNDKIYISGGYNAGNDVWYTE